METRPKSPARILAPVALVVFALALILVIAGSGGGGDGGESSRASSERKERDLGTSSSERERRREERRERREDRLPEDVYVVQEGDTLEEISDKTGVPVERLEELNPGLDQFQLTEGQRIKLR
jgi:hypothetical protein